MTDRVVGGDRPSQHISTSSPTGWPERRIRLSFPAALYRSFSQWAARTTSAAVPPPPGSPSDERPPFLSRARVISALAGSLHTRAVCIGCRINSDRSWVSPPSAFLAGFSVSLLVLAMMVEAYARLAGLFVANSLCICYLLFRDSDHWGRVWTALACLYTRNLHHGTLVLLPQAFVAGCSRINAA